MKTRTRKPQGARSLASTLTIVFVVLSVVVLFAYGALQLFASYQIQQQAIYSNQQRIAEDASKSVLNFIGGKFASLNTGLGLTDLATASQQEQNLMLDSMLGLEPAFRQLVLLNAQDQQVADASRLSKSESKSIAAQFKSDALAQVRQGKQYISPIYIDEVTSEPLVVIAVPALNALKESQGTLMAEVNLKFMWDLVDQIKVGQTGYAYVVDRQGTLIAFRDVARVLRNENERNISEVAEFIESTSEEDETPIGVYTGLQGTTVVGQYVQLRSPDWAVFVELPWQEAYSNIIRQVLMAAGSGVILDILIGLCGLVLARRLAAPVASLTATATRIAEGELELQAAPSGPQETVSLAVAFNSMTAQLREKIESLNVRGQELEARRRELEASQRVTFAASKHTSPDELLDLVVNLIRDQFNLYHVQVYLVDAEQQTAVLRKSTGYAGRQLLQQGHQIPLQKTALITRAIHEGEPVLVNDVHKEEGFLSNPLLPDTQSEMVVPLKVGDRVLGALDVQSREVETFTPNLVALYQTMAEQVALMFESTDLLDRTTEQAKVLSLFTSQLSTAAEVTRRMSAILDPERLLSTVVDLMQSRFGLYHVHVFLVDETTNDLVMRAGSGEVGKVLRERGYKIPLDQEQSLVARAARERTPAMISDTVLAPDFMPNPLLPQTRSELVVPLIAGDKVLGVLDAQDDEVNHFGQSDMDVFSTLAGQIATALQNARLFVAQKQAEAAVRESQQRFQGLVETLTDWIWEVDANGAYTYVSPRVRDLLGYEPEEVLGKTPFDLMPAEEAQRVAGVFGPLLMAQQPLMALENINRHKDGHLVVFETSGLPFFDAQGQFKGYRGTDRDVTERKLAEQALRESEARYSALVTQAKEGVLVIQDNVLTLVNQGLADILGYASPEELVGTPFINHVAPEHRPLIADRVKRRLAGEDVPSLYEARLLCKDGTLRDTEISGTTIEYQGKLSNMGLIRDITERKQAEEAVRESRQRFQGLVETLNDWIWEVDQNGIYTYVSPKVRYMLGYEPEELLGKSPFDLMPAEEAKRVASVFLPLLQAQQPLPGIENTNLHKDGRLVVLETSGAPYFDAQGQFKGYRGIDRDITERKQAQEEIAIFQALAQNATDAIAMTNLDGIVVYANHAFYDLYGFDFQKQELIGMPAISCTPEEYLSRTAEAMGQAMTTGAWAGEQIQRHKDGSLFTVSISAFPVRNQLGQPIRLGTVMRDMTERKQAEEAIRESRQRFQGLVETLTDWIWEVDPNGKYTYVSPRVRDLLGYEPEEVLGKTPFDLMPAEEAQRVAGVFGPLLSTQQPLMALENTNLHKDGHLVVFETSGLPFFDAQGQFKGYRGTDRDVTERKQAEKERERFTKQLQTAAEVSEQISSVLDPDELLGKVVTSLKERFDLYHVHIYTLDEAEGNLVMRAGSGEAGRVMREQEHKIPLDREHSLVARAARTRGNVSVGDVTEAPDYMPNPLLPETRSEVAVPLVSGDHVLGVFDVQHNQPNYFTATDLNVFTTLAGQVSTALQNARLFDEAQQTAERLREVDRLKSEFLANMSHELRTPLNSIIGYSEVMLMGLDGGMDPETQADVQAIYDNGHHLLHLINDVLDLAKIEAGRLTLNMEEVNLSELLDEVKTNNAGLILKSQKPIEFDIAAEGELTPVWGDRLRLNQILSNLVSNAIKFTEQGSVRLRAFRQNGWMCMEVQDTGIGISEADLPQLFEKFHQVDGSHKRRAEGTGLGLAISRYLIEMHGGTIDVQSKLGAGSTFTVRLPARHDKTEA